jgi:hypothetical protein
MRVAFCSGLALVSSSGCWQTPGEIPTQRFRSLRSRPTLHVQNAFEMLRCGPVFSTLRHICSIWTLGVHRVASNSARTKLIPATGKSSDICRNAITDALRAGNLPFLVPRHDVSRLIHPWPERTGDLRMKPHKAHSVTVHAGWPIPCVDSTRMSGGPLRR